MIGLLFLLLAFLASPFKSKSRLEAENAVLRHQLIILRRKVRGRVRLTSIECHGHPGQAYRTGVALAEWLRGTVDRIDPARVRGPYGCLG